MNVDFQIIHSFTDDENLKENLLLLLKDTFDESTTISTEIEEQPENIVEWSIFYWIETKYNHLLDGAKYIAGFILDLEEDFEEIIQEFGKKLQDDENIDLVLKYSDEGMQVEHQKYAKEIFDIEMRLREVISFIFIDTYGGDYYNFLEFQTVRMKGIKENEKQNAFKERFQNEFFFLTFSQYRNIDLQNIIKCDILTVVFEESNLYEDIKERILRLGVVRSIEKYRKFLNSIEQDMQSIEELRNCIAHNRFIDVDRESYEHAKDGLEQSINDFWNEIQNED